MLSLDRTFLITPFVCLSLFFEQTKGVIKNVQSRDSIGHNTKNKDKQNKRGYQECTIQRPLDCTFLITPFVLFVFVLCIVANAVSGLYILDYPPFVLFVFVLCIVPNAVSGLYILDCTFLITPFVLFSIGHNTKNKDKQTKMGVIKNVQSRDSIGHNTKNKDKQNKRGNQECTIQRQHS
jgi:hypothetical protein